MNFALPFKTKLLLVIVIATLFSIACGRPPQPDNQADSESVKIDFNWPDNAAIFTVDTTQSSAEYTVREFFLKDANEVLGRKQLNGTAFTSGLTPQVSGEFALNLEGDSPQLLGGQIIVDISALQSNRPERDEMIQRNWLESNTYPLAVFTLTDAQGIPQTYTSGNTVSFTVNGDLTIRDVTQPAQFHLVGTLSDSGLEAVGETTLYMTSFGFDPPNMANVVEVDNDLLVRIELVATR